MIWRVGGTVTLNVYENNKIMFQCHTPEDAARVVALLNRTEALQAAVLNITGDDLCWFKHEDKGKIPPAAEFLESCTRYHAQIASERGELVGCMTIAQLERHLARTEAALANCNECSKVIPELHSENRQLVKALADVQGLLSAAESDKAALVEDVRWERLNKRTEI